MLVQEKTVEIKENAKIFDMDVDYENTLIFGYYLAIMTVAFVFSGVFVLNLIVTEQQDLVFMRIMLTKAGEISYLMGKILMILFASFVQTAITVAAYAFLVKEDVGITLFQLGYIVFLMGVLFNILSVCIGIYADSTMTAVYFSFIVWVITALLGGLYFDISSSTGILRQISMLMPQRWALKAAAMFQTQNSAAYPMLLAVTAAFVIVIMVAGILGLRLKRKD